jgi:hypothetical protein
MVYETVACSLVSRELEPACTKSRLSDQAAADLICNSLGIVLPAVVKSRLVLLPLNEKFSLREISATSLSFSPLPHWHNQE